MMIRRSLTSSIKRTCMISKYGIQNIPRQHMIHDKSQQLFHLQKLLKEDKIGEYFAQKTFGQYSKADIQFYLLNIQIFRKMTLQHQKEELLNNKNVNCPLYFQLSARINYLFTQQTRKQLSMRFKRQYKQLSINDFLICLHFINQINQKQQLDGTGFGKYLERENFYETQLKLINQNLQVFFQAIYYFTKLKVQLQVIQPYVISAKLHQVENLTIESILWIKDIADYFDIQLSEQLQMKIYKFLLYKAKNYDKYQGSRPHLVKLLSYYPQVAYYVNPQNMTSVVYHSYLKFYEDSKKTLIQQPKIKNHPIPQRVIDATRYGKFTQIIQFRRILLDEKMQILILNIDKFYDKRLHCVLGLIRCYNKTIQIPSEVQFKLQKSLLRNIVQPGLIILNKYQIFDVISIFSYMSSERLGSVEFWKKSLRFIYQILENKQSYKNLTPKTQIKFLTNMFRIFSFKSLPVDLQNNLVNLALMCLARNSWTLQQIYEFAIALKLSHMIIDNLWLGIEQKFMKINLNYNFKLQDRRLIVSIGFILNTIHRGSYHFWKKLDGFFTIQEKQHILNQSQLPCSKAHTYFTM